MPATDPPSPSTATMVATRLALQSVAEHVLCAARHRATGRIGLRSSPGGPTTPPFPSAHGARTVAIDRRQLVVVDDRGEQRIELTSVGAAAHLLGTEPGAPTEVFTPTTPLEPDAPLAIDERAAIVLARWWRLVDEALERLRAEHADESPAEVQLWPEHFDIATSIGEVNHGGSPGDEDHPLPYLYVGPWSPPPPDGGFWNRGFGALLPATEVATADDALAFFRAGRSRLEQLSG